MDALIAAREMRALVWTDVDLQKGQLCINGVNGRGTSARTKAGGLVRADDTPSKQALAAPGICAGSENALVVNKSKG